jgi:IS1 family transposase
MNRLSTAERAKVVSVLVEGNSLRATARITGVARMTIEKLLRDLGAASERFHNERVRGLKATRVQCDEIWAFVGAKQKNVSAEKADQGWGDVWTWVALDADTKLVPTYRVGSRDLQEAQLFMQDVAKRLRNRVQLTTDGHRPYLRAVEDAFNGDVDYAQLIKIYGAEGGREKGRYSPAICLGSDKQPITGSPDRDHISASYVERQNLTMRMSMRRFTRLTNAFSKKVENLAAAVSLHFAYYNFCRVHQSLSGKTPAMAAGISDHVWKLDELIALLQAAESTPIKRGHYQKTRATRMQGRNSE